MLAGFAFLVPRTRRQDRALEIGRNLLVSLFGLSEIAQELADARILRVLGRLLVETEGLRLLRRIGKICELKRWYSSASIWCWPVSTMAISSNTVAVIG